MMSVLPGLLPVFFALAVGYLSGKLHVVDGRHVGALNAVVMKIALPIALFVILAGAPRADVIEHGAVAAAVFVVMAVTYVAVYLLQRHVWKVDRAGSAVQALTVAFPNTAAVALPIAGALLGRTGELAVAVSLAVGSITLTPATILILNGSGEDTPPKTGHRRGRSIVRSLSNPVVIAPIAGVVWSLLGLPLPALASSTLDEIGGLTAGLALFLTGVVLSSQRIRLTANVAVSTLIGALARPALALLAVWAFGMTGTMARETVLLLAVPAGFFGILLSLDRGINADTAGATLFFTTILSAATLPLTILLIQSL
ncbi:AEC family transporter [Microbacterium caowuchunii]|uniref:AEC family transporter n=1 Tax=Microbacterium caowuchunii TaxID=2614638 RepID=A0A5N0TLZ4_9MICO|nr:AEC family transporter [Microbacterium caowuchunii]KAA9136130.1 AEC family transporter [Microbacterium caowuchunii]